MTSRGTNDSTTTSPSAAAPAAVFLPTTRDVVLIESYHSMVSTGFDCAFLQHSQTGMGVLIDSRGFTAEIPPEKWSEFLIWVTEAKTVVTESGGGRWSRPQYESCPTARYYDLGPAATKQEFVQFQLDGHEIYGDVNPDEILRSVNGKETVVLEVPPAVVKVESAIADMKKELLPDYSHSRETIPDDIQEVWNAVDSMAPMRLQSSLFL